MPMCNLSKRYTVRTRKKRENSRNWVEFIKWKQGTEQSKSHIKKYRNIRIIRRITSGEGKSFKGKRKNVHMMYYCWFYFSCAGERKTKWIYGAENSEPDRERLWVGGWRCQFGSEVLDWHLFPSLSLCRNSG
jgi:hypothetical protein